MGFWDSDTKGCCFSIGQKLLYFDSVVDLSMHFFGEVLFPDDVLGEAVLHSSVPGSPQGPGPGQHSVPPPRFLPLPLVEGRR